MKDERIELRVKPDHKKILETAAYLSGLSMSSFMLNHALKAAKKELGSFRKLDLSSRDRDVFLSMLENPPKPNKSLKDAVKRFKKY